MFATLVRRLADKPAVGPAIRNTQIPVAGSPASGGVKPKKVWPPDFTKLSEKEQFRFERRYKRRVQLATARPRWDKFIKLAQLSSITFFVVYATLFMDWQTENPPVQGIRDKFWGVFGSHTPDQRREYRKPDIQTTNNEQR